MAAYDLRWRYNQTILPKIDRLTTHPRQHPPRGVFYLDSVYVCSTMNYMNIVFDASTLILLAKIDLLRIVAECYSIIIPDKVKTEALAADSSDAMAIRYLLDSSLIRTMSIKNGRNFEKFVTDFRIHDGEAEALCLALELSAPVAVDDGPAIKASKIMGIKFITAIHFVINCAQTGAMNQVVALEKLKKLSIVGRYRLQIIQDAEKRICGGGIL